MRVLFITRKYPPSVGGMETYSKCLFEALSRLEEEVDIYRPRTDIVGRPSLRQISAFALGACWLLIRRGRSYDVVLLGDYALSTLAVAAKVTTFGKIRTVVSLHGNDLYFMRKRSLLALVYRALSRLVVASRCLDAAIANSRAIREEGNALGITPIHVIPLATDVIAPAPRPSSDGDTRRIVFTGRLIRYKGLSWFVRNVWPRLDPRIELLVAGQAWDQSELDCVRDQPRIRYLGAVPRQELPPLLASAMASIMPNIPPDATEQDEGFGLVALEAPALGTPVVASRCGGIPDAVADGITGFLLPPLDADAWVRCLNAIAEWSPAQRLAFAAASTRYIAEHFNWSMVAERTMAVLRDKDAQVSTNCAS